MTERSPEEQDRADEEARRRAAAERRRRQVFGDLLDESTLDDRPDSGPSTPEDERWLRDNVPPHHGGE